MSHEDVVRAVYTAYHARDWPAFRALIADGFTFTSPYDDAIDIAAYRERCWPPGDSQKEFKIERVSGDNDGGFITYFVTMENGASFRNTEYLHVRGGKVKSVDVYFGASYRGGKFAAKTPE